MRRATGGSEAEPAAATAVQGLPPRLVAIAVRCHTFLEEVLAREPSLRFACLSLVDGRVVSHSMRAPGERAAGARVAAMTSSTLALAEAFAQESLGGRCDYATFASDRGNVVVVRVPAKEGIFTLSVGMDQGETLAMALRVALDTARALAERVDGPDATN